MWPTKNCAEKYTEKDTVKANVENAIFTDLWMIKFWHWLTKVSSSMGVEVLRWVDIFPQKYGIMSVKFQIVE